MHRWIVLVVSDAISVPKSQSASHVNVISTTKKNKNKRARSLSPTTSFVSDKKRNTSNPIAMPTTNPAALENLVFNGNFDPTVTVQLENLVLPIENKSRSDDFRSIYLTKFRPIAKVENVMASLKQFNEIIDIFDKTRCTRLVNRNRNSDKLSFVSFKLDVPVSHFEMLLDGKFWPQNVTAKEFVDRERTSSGHAIPNTQSTMKSRHHHAKQNFNYNQAGSSQINSKNINRRFRPILTNQPQIFDQSNFDQHNHQLSIRRPNNQRNIHQMFNPFSLNRTKHRN